MTDVSVTPIKFGIGGNADGWGLYYIEGAKAAQNDVLVVLGVSEIKDDSVMIKEDGTPTALETVTVSGNEITCGSANVGTMSGYIVARQ